MLESLQLRANHTLSGQFGDQNVLVRLPTRASCKQDSFHAARRVLKINENVCFVERRGSCCYEPVFIESLQKADAWTLERAGLQVERSLRTVETEKDWR